MKQGGEAGKAVRVVCPAEISPEEEKAVYEMARHVFEVMDCPDLGRVDVRLREDGVPYFIELNPLPSLHPDASMMTAARESGLEFKEVLRLILRSATRRYHIPLRQPKKLSLPGELPGMPRVSARELGIFIGRLSTGINNAITDVKGVKVGHFTQYEDQVQIPGIPGITTLRSGVTAILPAGGTFSRRLVAGGYVLNGVGEMAGLTQVLELGWLETPIILTNSNSVGMAHTGVVNFMTRKYPELAAGEEVVMPIVGEADDSFLNDPVGGVNTARNVVQAMESAQSGPVMQGSVGAGTGMISYDFAGGIGTASRVFNMDEGLFTVGVLVMSNLGRMRNLTIEGQVVGKTLDELYPMEGRREHQEGSIIVVVATDLPLLSSQLNRVSRRAALGLGRTGSYAASSSGEIVVAFSTANRTLRTASRSNHFINLRCISDSHINLLYEAVIEATEEAVLNAMFCSAGMSGRQGREAPPLPHDLVLEILRKGREIG
jgi:L-aminopeptidase/D-esterase-like protein